MKQILSVFGLIALCGCATTDTPSPKFSRDMPSKAMPLYISSIGSGFAVEGEFDGTYQVHGDFIELNFKSAEIRMVGSPTNRGPRRVTSIRIGLARNTEGVKWDTLNMVEIAAPDRVMQFGDLMRFSPGSVRVPIGLSLDLSKHWFVVDIRNVLGGLPNEKQQLGSCYAHSDKDIFRVAK